VVVTYLHMLEPPAGEALPSPPGVSLVRLTPSVGFYRYLYESVGGPWGWTDRKALSDRDLAAILGNPRVEVWVVYVGEEPAGYFEIDRRRRGQARLVYFGLMPAFIGQGLGRWLLDAAVRIAWQGGPRRLLVNTCTLDHPAALPLYQKAGFIPYRRVLR
jgi:GNAT superfamily N-acetyltransferase